MLDTASVLLPRIPGIQLWVRYKEKGRQCSEKAQRKVLGPNRVVAELRNLRKEELRRFVFVILYFIGSLREGIPVG
jgi:hypothetical protein